MPASYELAPSTAYNWFWKHMCVIPALRRRARREEVQGHPRLDRESEASLEIHEALSPKGSRKNITFSQRSLGLTSSKLYIAIINFTREIALRPLGKVKRLFERLKTSGCACV